MYIREDEKLAEIVKECKSIFLFSFWKNICYRKNPKKSSKLYWGPCIVSIVKIPSRKPELWLIVSTVLGRPTQVKTLAKEAKSNIVKAKSWKSRKKFYNTRPKHFTNSKRKPGQHLFSISADLTRRR